MSDKPPGRGRPLLWAQAPAGGVALRLDARVQVAAA
jgi:hypothetical protein